MISNVEYEAPQFKKAQFVVTVKYPKMEIHGGAPCWGRLMEICLRL